MTSESERISDARKLDALVDSIKGELSRAGHAELIQEIDEAMLAGSTGLEIHFRLRGALAQIRSRISDQPQLARTIDEAVSLIDQIVRRGA